MARTNQGIFKELKNKYEKLEDKYKQVIESNFRDGAWTGNGYFFQILHIQQMIYIALLLI